MFGSSGTLNLGTAWRTHRMRLGDHSRDGVVSLVKICSSGPFLICKKEGGREMGGREAIQSLPATLDIRHCERKEEDSEEEIEGGKGEKLATCRLLSRAAPRQRAGLESIDLPACNAHAPSVHRNNGGHMLPPGSLLTRARFAKRQNRTVKARVICIKLGETRSSVANKCCACPLPDPD